MSGLLEKDCEVGSTAVVAAAVAAAITAEAAATAIAAVTAAATTPTTATEAAAAAATTAEAAATTAATEATTTARGTLFARTRDVHGQGTILELVTVELLHGLLGFIGAAHRDEGKAARATGELVEDDLNDADGANLAKQGFEILGSAGEGKIPHVEL